MGVTISNFPKVMISTSTLSVLLLSVKALKVSEITEPAGAPASGASLRELREDAPDLVFHEVTEALAAARTGKDGRDDLPGSRHADIGGDQQLLERFGRSDVDLPRARSSGETVTPGMRPLLKYRAAGRLRTYTLASTGTRIFFSSM